MRRIVTGHDEQGRSCVESIETLPDHGMQLLYTIGAGELEVDHSGEHIAVVPPRGAARWMFVSITPDAQLREALRGGQPGIDPDGWHTTPTVDYVHIIDGPLVLRLDTGDVPLDAGDCVVQRATRHAWRNDGDRPVRMAAVMITM